MEFASFYTRGVRNNNPFNIRRTSDNWKGMSSDSILQPFSLHDGNYALAKCTDSQFVVFDNMIYGLRAGLILLKNYVNKYGCNTPEKIVKRFAPASENNTEAYISFVCRGVSSDPYRHFNRTDVLVPYDTDFLVLCTRIIYYESNLVCDIETLQYIINKFNL